jgi:F-type H+-transporting ATPase subunit a
LHILTGFIFSLYNLSKIAVFFTFIVILSVSSLELFLAILQAYVFTVLTCIYLSDSLNPINH